MHSSDYTASTERPRYSAYMPPANGRKSVYRTDMLSEAAIRAIADEFVVPHRGQAKGHAHQSAAIVMAQGLAFDPDGVPHPRHANIVGWTSERAKNRLKAENIAASATAVLYGP